MPHEEMTGEEPTPTEQPGENPRQAQGQEGQGQGGVPAPPSAIPPADDSGQSREPNPIGVPNMVYDSEAGEYVPFTASVPRTSPGTSDVLGGRGGLTDAPPTTTFEDVRPTYYNGDEQRLFATRPRHDIIRIQRGLVEAGLLDPDDLNDELGTWGGASADAMKDVLGFANATGTQNWEVALNRRIQASQEGDELEAEAEPLVEPYQAPSYEELAEAARTTASDMIGRELKHYEVKLLAEKLGSFHRQAHETDVAVQRAQLDAERELAEQGAGAGEDVQTPTVNGIQDPGLAFKAFAREHFREEVERDEDVQETAQNRNLALRIFRSLGEV